jgi:ATP-dependent Clp protease ATP-binding subunit ClpA
MPPMPVSLDNLIAYVRSLHPDGGPLDHLSDAVVTGREMSDQADALIGHFVDQARGSGASWSQIGAAMGVTKQAAQKRFTARGEPLMPETKAFSHFTPRARMAVAAASQLAEAGGTDALDTPHLAAGALLDPAGLAAKALSRLDVTAEQVYDALGVGTPTPAADAEPATLLGLQYTAGCREAFKQALRTALRHGHNYIGTEHLLLGALTADGPAGEAVAKLGLRTDLIEGAITVEIAEALLQQRRQAG